MADILSCNDSKGLFEAFKELFHEDALPNPEQEVFEAQTGTSDISYTSFLYLYVLKEYISKEYIYQYYIMTYIDSKYDLT